MQTMLNENDVVEAVVNWLRLHGYSVLSQASTSQQGVDIAARFDSGDLHELRIEAKGATSATVTSNRYGQPFDSGQQFDHVAKAVLTCLKVCSLQSSPKVTPIYAGLALAWTQRHQSIVDEVRPALKRLGIRIFWVKPNREVILEQ